MTKEEMEKICVRKTDIKFDTILELIRMFNGNKLFFYVS